MLVSVLASGVWDNFATGFGIVAAVLAVGGIVFLRFQRNRQEYALMREALEKGIADFPTGQPLWLASFRQGLMLFTLGIGLAGVGAAAWASVDDKADILTIPATQPAGTAQTSVLFGPKPRDERGRLTAEGRLYSTARERWTRAQNQQLTGQILVGSGAILLLLGAVRMGFARVERKYFIESQP